MKHSSTIINVEVNPVNAELDQYRVDVRFKCNDCGHEYLVGDEDQEKFDEFVESLKTNNPIKYIGCPECDKKYQNNN